MKAALTGLLLLVSLLLSAFLAEGVARLVLNPVDYLAVDPVYDPVLRVHIPPHTSGHDAWGFRNRAVPDSADIVTIGDSQTYGISAPAALSWPSQLATVTGHTVYNLGLGGYGPVQYHELLRTRALTLRPRAVVIGLYFGNDLLDAYTTVYGLRHWSHLRRPGFPTVSDSMAVVPDRRVLFGFARDWLARHSVVYRVASFAAIGGLARSLEFSAQTPGRDVIPFRHPGHGARTGLTPRARLQALDPDSATVREGLRLSLDQLEQIGRDCRAARVQLLVALIPTKERVMEPWLGSLTDGADGAPLRRLLHSEAMAHREITTRLDSLGLRFIDLLPPLREAASVRSIYPANDDGHPNSEGYAAIAGAIARELRQFQGLTW